MKTWLKVVLAIVGVLVVIGAGLGFYLTRPVVGDSFHDSISYDSRLNNSLTLTTLAALGITDAVTGVNGTDLYIGYRAPAGNDTSNATVVDFLQNVVLGVAGGASHTGTTTIVLYNGTTAIEVWKADLVTLQPVLQGTADESAYMATVQKTAL